GSRTPCSGPPRLSIDAQGGPTRQSAVLPGARSSVGTVASALYSPPRVAGAGGAEATAPQDSRPGGLGLFSSAGREGAWPRQWSSGKGSGAHERARPRG